MLKKTYILKFTIELVDSVMNVEQHLISLNTSIASGITT